MVAKENRALFAPLMIGTMSVGGMVMALIAYLIPYWRHFLRVIYGPALLFLFYAFFLDESVRWLLIKGRKKEAKNILRKAAKLSNVYLEESTLDKLACENCEKTNTNVNLITLLTMTFKSKKLLLRFLACACAWITATFNKYGLLINSVSLEGNKYINYALTSFADLPASVLLVFLLIKFKRKKPLIFSFLMTGSFCIIQSVIPKGKNTSNIVYFIWSLNLFLRLNVFFFSGYPVLSTSLFFVGKFTSALASGTVYLYTTELFPTYTRNTMHALCSSIGRIGSILAPQTTLLVCRQPFFFEKAGVVISYLTTRRRDVEITSGVAVSFKVRTFSDIDQSVNHPTSVCNFNSESFDIVLDCSSLINNRCNLLDYSNLK